MKYLVYLISYINLAASNNSSFVIHVKSHVMKSGLIALMDRTGVVNYLTAKVSKFAADIVTDLPYSFGVKGTRFNDNILVQDLKHILTPHIVREMECEVITALMAKEDIYYTGILINDIQ